MQTSKINENNNLVCFKNRGIYDLLALTLYNSKSEISRARLAKCLSTNLAEADRLTKIGVTYGLLEEVPNGGKPNHRTTSKGLEFIERYNGIIKLLFPGILESKNYS